ncbi:MAG TPA: glutamyl-tRNA reductase [Gemmatimonadota bacterium]|nr:glutamyl-tRNA reductase [Gemmatimonadota bacterium]
MTYPSITALGISHKTAPLSVRERFALARPARRRLLESVGRESLILVTCNRTELYALAPPAELDRLLLAAAGVGEGVFYVHQGEAAARHLFAVAAGLDSMVLGEPQILGQVKRAMAEAREARALGPVLDELLRRALTVGRRVRRETDLGRGLPSIPKVATGMARLILGDLSGRRMLVVGAGKLGDLTARTLQRAGASSVAVTNRSPEHAETLAQTIGGRAEPFEALDRLLAEADIVLTCTASEAPILTRQRVERALVGRVGDPLVLLDIAVPRDVDAEVRGLAGVRLCDLDDLRGWGSEAVSPETIAAAREIVDAEARDFLGWQAGLSAVPTIRALQARAEWILEDEIERASAADREELRLFGRRVMRKLLHHPIRRLRDSVQAEGDPYLALARDLFGLEGPEPDARPDGGGRAGENGGPTRGG